MSDSVLLITGIFPPDSGGPSKFAFEFGKWSSRNDIDLAVLTYSDKIESAEDVGDMKVSRILRSNWLPIRYIKMIWAIGNKISPNVAVFAVGAFLETYAASIIYRFKYVAKVPGDIVWERAQNNSLTELSIDDFQLKKLNLKYKMFRKLYSNSLKRASKVIVPSLGLYNLCLFWGVKKENIHIIYNSIDSIGYSKIPTINPEYELVTVCRLVPWKGVAEVIEYAAKRNLKLAVVGDGPEREKLFSLADSLNAKVTFTGNIAPSLVNQILQKSRIFVLNSNYEGLPHALVEARLAGLISVGRAGTGSEEVINDGVDGYLVREDRPLETTLDLAFSQSGSKNDFVEKAKADSNSRFNKEINYLETSKVIMGNI